MESETTVGTCRPVEVRGELRGSCQRAAVQGKRVERSGTEIDVIIDDNICITSEQIDYIVARTEIEFAVTE